MIIIYLPCQEETGLEKQRLLLETMMMPHPNLKRLEAQDRLALMLVSHTTWSYKILHPVPAGTPTY